MILRAESISRVHPPTQLFPRIFPHQRLPIEHHRERRLAVEEEGTSTLALDVIVESRTDFADLGLAWREKEGGCDSRGTGRSGWWDDGRGRGGSARRKERSREAMRGGWVGAREAEGGTKEKIVRSTRKRPGK